MEAAAVLGSLLAPGTDRAVLVEVLATGAVLAAALVFTWSDREWRVLVLGVTVFILAFFAFRTLH